MSFSTYYSRLEYTPSILKIKPKFCLSRQSSVIYRYFVLGRGYHLGGDPVGGLGSGLGSSLGSRFLSWLGGWLGGHLGSGLGDNLGSDLRSELGSRLGSGLGGSLGSNLPGRLGGWLLINNLTQNVPYFFATVMYCVLKNTFYILSLTNFVFHNARDVRCSRFDDLQIGCH
jgi:hypothetical protein